MTTIVTRVGKGSALTWEEADDNFTNLQTTVDDHVADTVGAHAATAISVDSTNLTGTSITVQGSLEELDNTIDNHIADTADAHDASAISFSATGSISSTDVQAAIAELDTPLAPTIQQFTSGSGTYTTPAGVKYIKVIMVGGGGGGGGSGADTTYGAGGAGGSTTFGSSLLTCTGGGGGNSSAGGTGGTATINSPAIGMGITGSTGGQMMFSSLATYMTAPYGGNAPHFAGGGSGGQTYAAGDAGQTNSGGGGGGGGNNAVASIRLQGGGGSGGFIEAIITSPSSTYAYAVGAAGTAGTAGTNGAAGGAGAAGRIIVWEYYLA